MATLTQDQKDLIDLAGKFIGGLAAFVLADKIFFAGAITPEFIRPAAGWLVCGGAALLGWRLVRK